MNLKQRLAKFLFKWHGWKVVGKPMPPEVYRCVFAFAPHTSNWDFYYGMLYMIGEGVPTKAAMKKFWTKFPFGLLIKPLGGVGIDRKINKDGTRKKQVEMLAALFDEYDQIALVIAPEGSRSKTVHWRTGFYHTARLAQVPIVTLTGNYEKREIEFGPVFSGEESLEEVMREMMKFYRRGVAKYPEDSALDERFM